MILIRLLFIIEWMTGLSSREAGRAAQLLRRLPNWGFDYDELIQVALHVLARHPDEGVPSSLKEAVSMMESIGILRRTVENRVTNSLSRIAGLVLGIDGRTWIEKEANLKKTLAAAIDRLASDGIRLVDKREYPDLTTDVARADAGFHLLGAISMMTSEFAYSVLVASAARSNDAMRHYWLTEENFIDKRGHETIVPSCYAESCAGLFLDGAGFRELIDVCERWYRFKDANEMPDVDDLDEAILNAAMNEWRPFFSAKHRQASFHDVVALSEADLAASDLHYGTLRKPAAVGTSRKPKEKFSDPYRENAALRAEHDDADTPFHTLRIRDTILTGGMSADGPYISVQRGDRILGGVALGNVTSIDSYEDEKGNDCRDNGQVRKWGIFKYNRELRAPLVDFTEADARRVADEFGVAFNREHRRFKDTKAWGGLKKWVASFPETAAHYSGYDSYIRGWYQAAVAENEADLASTSRLSR
ncbi:hypothetical protein ACVIGB_001081 [Bradyrhizobium sp. USDA 4341]